MANLLGDLGKASESFQSSSDSRQHKVRVVGGSEAHRGYLETERELLRTITKGYLSQDQQTRLLKSLLECYRMAIDGKVHTQTKAGMSALIKAQSQLKEQGMDGPSIQEKLGAAHFHVWNGVLTAAVEMAAGEQKELIQRHIQGTCNDPSNDTVPIAHSKFFFCDGYALPQLTQGGRSQSLQTLACVPLCRMRKSP